MRYYNNLRTIAIIFSAIIPCNHRCPLQQFGSNHLTCDHRCPLQLFGSNHLTCNHRCPLQQFGSNHLTCDHRRPLQLFGSNHLTYDHRCPLQLFGCNHLTYDHRCPLQLFGSNHLTYDHRCPVQLFDSNHLMLVPITVTLYSCLTAIISQWSLQSSLPCTAAWQQSSHASTNHLYPVQLFDSNHLTLVPAIIVTLYSCLASIISRWSL